MSEKQKTKAFVPPYTYDPLGAFIVDGSGERVLDLRGWGRLTGLGAGGLGLDEDEASRVQDDFGRWVAGRLNAEPKAKPEVVFVKPVEAPGDMGAVEFIERLRREVGERLNAFRIVRDPSAPEGSLELRDGDGTLRARLVNVGLSPPPRVHRFAFKWRDGSRSEGQAEEGGERGASRALSALGYGAGALNALDSWEELT